MVVTIASSSRYKINRPLITNKSLEVLSLRGLAQNTSLSIAFVGKNKMRTISRTYKDEDVALPVLAFPFHETRDDMMFLGEIIICYPQAVLLAAQQNKRVDDVINWLTEHAIDNLVK
jgi:rRNA maturation RNase YbeY